MASQPETQISFDRRQWWGGVLAIFVLALGVRLVHLYGSAGAPTIRQPIGDAAGYLAWALRLAAGDWLGTQAFYQAPLYPYVLGVWQMFGFDSVGAARILQAFFGAFASTLLAIAAAKLFSPRVGFIAGLMHALYAPAIFFDGIIQKASLDGLLVCAVLTCIASIMTRVTPGRTMLLGAVVSLLCLTRENAIAWHFVLCVWITWWCAGSARALEVDPPSKRTAATPTLSLFMYLFGAAIVLVPVGLRNAYVQGEFLLTTSQAGPNFYIGNNANADGRYQPLVRGHETPVFEQADATRLAEHAEERSLTSREVSRHWLRRAWKDIADDPGRWFKLTGYKLLLTWNRYEIADAESIVIHRRSSPVLDTLTRVWHFGVLAPLAVLGVALTWNNRRRLAVFYELILVMTLAVAAFYVMSRYRYPLVPLLIPFAAAGVVELWKNRNQPGKSTKGIVLAIVFAIVVNWPIQDEARLDALAEMNAGVALAQMGEIEAAGESFARAVRGHPTSAEANYNLAISLAVQGRYADAIPHYERSVALQPDLPGLQFNLAVALEQAGHRDRAMKHYRMAIEQDPADVEAKAALDRLQK